MVSVQEEYMHLSKLTSETPLPPRSFARSNLNQQDR